MCKMFLEKNYEMLLKDMKEDIINVYRWKTQDHKALPTPTPITLHTLKFPSWTLADSPTHQEEKRRI